MSTITQALQDRTLLEPDAGWSADQLPDGPGTVLQYFNARDERIIAVLCDTRLWRVTAVTGRGAVRQLSWTPAALAADLWRVAYYDVVPEP